MAPLLVFRAFLFNPGFSARGRMRPTVPFLGIFQMIDI